MLPQEPQANTSAKYSASHATIQTGPGGSDAPTPRWPNRRWAATIAPSMGGAPAVTRNNVLYLVVGALAVAVAVLGYQLYQDRHKKPEGLNINLGPGGISIDKK